MTMPDLLNTIDAGGGYAEHYTSEPYGHHKAEVYKLFVDLIAGVAVQRPNILDIGGGPAHLAWEYHRVHPDRDARWTILDSSSELLRLAHERFTDKPDRIATAHRSFNQPGWTEGLGSFDIIASNNALFFLPPQSITSFYADAFALLSHDGMILNQQTFAWNDQESPYSDAPFSRFMRGIPPDIMSPTPQLDSEGRKKLAERQRAAVARNTAALEAAKERGERVTEASSYHFVTAETHLAAMRAAGFAAGCIWRKREFAVVAGIKGAPL
jgi:hypothetical protein